MSYAELQVTTHYSFLRGASSPEELFAAAATLGITALGIVDRNSLAGIVRAHEAAKATGVRLIVGCRLDLQCGTSLLVYPTDRLAYARLCRLLTLGKTRAGKGQRPGMTDEVGQAALMALAEWRDRLATIDGAHRRAHWLYVRSRDAFRQAEEIRYADENQNAQRLWDGFVGPRLLKLKNDPPIVDQFKEALEGLAWCWTCPCRDLRPCPQSQR
jgi:DNA polymerase III alpha subunit